VYTGLESKDRLLREVLAERSNLLERIGVEFRAGMPELPEVETVRRIFDRCLTGETIAELQLPDDPIFMKQDDPARVRETLLGAKVLATGRRGKTFWFELEDRPYVVAHLGMTGIVREVTDPECQLAWRETGAFFDADGNVRFLKLQMKSSSGRVVALADGRRLARLWLADSLESDKKLSIVGRDWWLDPMTPQELHAVLSKRKAPMKALLLDQKVSAGVGNWIADEALYQARIAPNRPADSLSLKETKALVTALKAILDLAVEAGANSEKYPEDWLFHFRWGGSKGHDQIGGKPIRREELGGRTTAWVPGVQK